MSERTRRLLPVAIPVAAILVAVVMVRLRPEPPRAAPPPAEPVVITRPAVVREGTIEVVGAGTVRPRAEIDLAMQVSGKVSFVDPALVAGGRVRAGQVLVRVDPADYDNAVERARADVAQQEVSLLQAEEEADIARAEYEQFLARQARLGLPAPGREPSRLVLREPQLAAARAARDRALAALRDADLARSRTEVHAPFDAVVRSESVDVGSFLSPGQPLARLYAADAVEVVVPLTDEDAALIPDLWSLRAGDGDRHVGALVTAEFGGRSHSWPGYVDRAQGTLDEVSRTIDVVVRVPDPFAGEAPLLVGQYTQVRMEGVSLDAYAIVPRAAVRPGDEVWVVDGSTVRIVPVRVLQNVDEQVFVVGDLADGAPLIIGGVQFATEGMRVRAAAPVARGRNP